MIPIEVPRFGSDLVWNQSWLSLGVSVVKGRSDVYGRFRIYAVRWSKSEALISGQFDSLSVTAVTWPSMLAWTGQPS